MTPQNVPGMFLHHPHKVFVVHDIAIGVASREYALNMLRAPWGSNRCPGRLTTPGGSWVSRL